MQILKSTTVFLIIWFLSNVGFTNGIDRTELGIIHNSNTNPEAPLIKELQALTYDLQLLELVVKNRRDPNTEAGISSAISEIHSEASEIGKKFRNLHTQQVTTVLDLCNLGKRFGFLVGVDPGQWSNLEKAVTEGAFIGGLATVASQNTLLNVVNLVPIRIGKETVWQFVLPKDDRFSFWNRTLKVSKKLKREMIEEIINKANVSYSESKQIAESFYKASHKKLYNSFQLQNFGILTRMNNAHKTLKSLSKMNSAMNIPEQYAQLYNQLLDHLYSYGVDISFNGQDRDFTIKGFLFGDSPEKATDLYRKLKVSVSDETFNSPSS